VVSEISFGELNPMSVTIVAIATIRIEELFDSTDQRLNDSRIELHYLATRDFTGYRNSGVINCL
jgi:hypothetical protein